LTGYLLFRVSPTYAPPTTPRRKIVAVEPSATTCPTSISVRPRQVILHTGVISDDGETLTGVYSETLWSLTPDPLVVTGRFRLIRLAHVTTETHIYLPLVLRNTQ
jgi:hypothetical protein